MIVSARLSLAYLLYIPSSWGTSKWLADARQKCIDAVRERLMYDISLYSVT